MYNDRRWPMYNDRRWPMYDNKGFVLYDGPSELDGTPIVVIVTFHSSNEATGDMPQVWYLLRDVAPTEALKRGLDVAICGNCPLSNSPANRAKGGGGCYVSTLLVNQVWHAYKRGVYPSNPTTLQLKRGLSGRPVRLGAYGDPTSAPIAIAKRLVRMSGNDNTGYTHQWKTCNPAWRHLLMASVENVAQKKIAHAAGWRTFRVMGTNNTIERGEILCPKDKSFGEIAKQCIDCRACDGYDRPGKVSIAINHHSSVPMKRIGMNSLDRLAVL